jgi:hypothetical protein
MINVFLPFMVLPIFAVVRMLDPRLPDAAATLGASPWFSFRRVTLPLSLPGVVAGVSLVFSLSVAAYVTPSLLMGDRYMTMSMVMAKAFLNLRDWQLGAAMAAVLLAILLHNIMAALQLRGKGMRAETWKQVMLIQAVVVAAQEELVEMPVRLLQVKEAQVERRYKIAFQVLQFIIQEAVRAVKGIMVQPPLEMMVLDMQH